MSFVGRTVRIQTLDYTVEGKVSSIENGRLVLVNVKSINTGESLEKMIIEGSQVTSVDLCDDEDVAQEKEVDEIEEAKKEFDFATNLDKFDKKAEFAKIASREAAKKPARSDKIPHNEMVTGQSNIKGSSPRGTVTLPAKNSAPQGQPSPQPKKVSEPHLKQENRPITEKKEKKAYSGTPPTLSATVSGVQTGPSLQTTAGISVPITTAIQLSKILSQMEQLGFSPASISERAAEGLSQIIGAQDGAVVLLVGTHIVGHWAIAAGRRLALRGQKVVAVSPATEAPTLLSDETRSFIAAGGHFVTTQKALFSVIGDEKPPALVIDALEGFEMPLVDQLDENEYAAATWLINWSAKATSRVSLCVPNLPNSNIVAFGFPLGPCAYIADIGIPQKALTALKLRRFLGLHWVSAVLQTV